jgi:WD40 repeat protein
MRYRHSILIILFIIICISACAPTELVVETIEATETSLPATPTATAIPPTPTANPFIIDEGIQSGKTVIFGNGAIEKMFVSKEHQNILVQTRLGIFLFDLQSMERLGYKQTDLEVLSFNGYDGYLLTHFHSPTGWGFARNYEIDNPDLTHFYWDDEFFFDRKINLKDWDGSNLVLLQAAISPKSSYVFGREDFRDDENNWVGINKDMNYGFWKNFKTIPTNFLNGQKYDVRTRNIGFSPDESQLAFIGEVGGTGTSVGDFIVFLADITEEGLSTPKRIFKHSDVVYRGIEFSPDSKKITSVDEEGQVLVYWAKDNIQKVFYMTEEDLVDDGSYYLVRDVGFLDNEHIAVATSSGNLIIWDINTEEKQVHSLGIDTPISFFALDSQTIIYCTNNGIFKYMLDSRTYQELNYDFGPFRSNELIIEDKMVSVFRLGNGSAEIGIWDLNSASRILTKTLDFDFPGDYHFRPQPLALQNGNILIGAETDGKEAAAILEIDTQSWDVINANPENTEVNFKYGVLFSKALDQYIAVNSNNFELLLTESNDPVFLTVVDRKKTLREILDINISRDGTQVAVLEKGGLVQIFNLVDPSLSKSIEFHPYDVRSIHFLDNNQIIIVSINPFQFGRKDWQPFKDYYEITFIDIASREVNKFQNDQLESCQASDITTEIDYPEGWVSLKCNDELIVYDLLAEKIVEEHSFSTEDLNGYFDWDYYLYPKPGYLLGKDYYGYFNIKEIISNAK